MLQTIKTKIETSLSIAMIDTNNSNFFSNQISVIIKKQQFRVYQTPDDHKKTNKDQIHKCCLKSSKSVFICSQITYITHYIFWRPPVTINWIYLFFRLCLSSVITSEIVGIKCLIVCIGDNFCCSEGKSIQKGD